MKKIILLGAFIAMSLVSCTKDDVKPTTQPKAVVTETTNVTMDFTAQGQSSKTAKTVNGGLYAWINEIDVTTKSNDFNYAPFLTPFYMTADAIGTVESGSPYLNNAGDIVVGNYTLNNVALGSNDFTITTKCNTPQILSFTSTTQAATDVMTASKGKNPYAIYGASILGQNVVKGTNSLPSTQLNTNNARACAVLTINPAMTALGITAKITPSSTTPFPQSIAPLTVNGTNNASFYWSNSNSVDGQTVTFTVDMYNNNNIKFNTFTATMTLVKSTSTNTIYTINESDITTNTDMGTFTAQPWENGDANNTTIGN